MDDLDKFFSKTKNEKGDSANASYYHIVNPSTNIAVVGAEMTHSFFTNVNTITVGTQHALDPLTTIKARANNAGKASALILHEWRPKSLFTISGEMDTKSIDKSPKNSVTGIGIKANIGSTSKTPTWKAFITGGEIA
ncbi:hypothetical protein GOBAR_DD16053 [Gossypium barbadense]|nr:hypothetical protein GOBAR_DD16053 [Gossypium barbadense]